MVMRANVVVTIAQVDFKVFMSSQSPSLAPYLLIPNSQGGLIHIILLEPPTATHTIVNLPCVKFRCSMTFHDFPWPNYDISSSFALIMTWLYQLTQSYIFIIFQELDKHWRIMTETAIKAKSIKGYSTYNRNIFWGKFLHGFYFVHPLSGSWRRTSGSRGLLSPSWWRTGTSGSWWPPWRGGRRGAGWCSCRRQRKTRSERNI